MPAGFRHEQGTWLYDRWMIDVPKIFDLCVLYGEENPDLTRRFLQNLFQLQPKYLNDVQEMVPTLVDNLYLLEERCNDAIVQLRHGNEMGLLGWTDVLKYLLDVCVNLSLFLDLYPAAGEQLMQNRGLLLCSLARIHDTLLPQFESTVRRMAEDAMQDLMQQSHLVMAAIQRTGFGLLKAAYLSVDSEDLSTKRMQVEPDCTFLSWQ